MIISQPRKQTWASGTKGRFLNSHNLAWQSATEQGPDEAGAFYSLLTKLWIKQYSWHFDHETDLEEDTSNPTPESLLEPAGAAR